MNRRLSTHRVFQMQKKNKQYSIWKGHDYGVWDVNSKLGAGIYLFNIYKQCQ